MNKSKTYGTSAALIAGLASLALFSGALQAAPLQYSPGDLVLTVRQAGNASDYLVNLGSVTNYNALAAGVTVPTSRFSATQFALAFPSINGVSWSVSGASRPPGTPGYPLQTLWVSAPRLVPEIQSPAWVRKGAFYQGTAGAQIGALGANAAAASSLLPAGPANTETGVVVSSTGDFSVYPILGSNGDYAGTYQGSVEVTTAEDFDTDASHVSRLDLYEVVPGASSSGTLNTPGKYLGYFELTPEAALSFHSPPAILPPTLVATSPTSDNTPTLKGSAVAGSTVSLYDGSELLGSVVADSKGVWVFTPTIALKEGEHSFKATSSGVASQTTTVLIDSIAPEPPILAPVGLVNSNTPIVSGTAEIGSTVRVYEGVTLAGLTKVDANGNWSFRFTEGLDDQSYSLTATATDLVGNISLASTAQILEVDTVAPKAPAFSTFSPTRESNPVIRGTATAGDLVQVYEGTTSLGSAVTGPDGNWSLTPTAPLSNGAHSLIAVATDTAGNKSAASPASVLLVDSLAPAVPTLVVINPSKTSRPSLSGAAEAGSVVKIYDGNLLLGTATTDVNGAWSLVLNSDLADGTHPITVTATDLLDNTSLPTPSLELVISTINPVPVITSITHTSGVTSVRFNTVAEVRYQLRAIDGGSLDTAPSSWPVISSLIGDGTPGVLQDASNATIRFFVVEALP